MRRAGTFWQRIDRWISQPRSTRQVIVWLSLYLGLTANWPLLNDLARLGGAPSTYMPTIAALGMLTFCGTVAMLSLTAWSRWMKPLWLLVVVIAAVAQHYMLQYRVVMDPA